MRSRGCTIGGGLPPMVNISMTRDHSSTTENWVDALSDFPSDSGPGLDERESFPFKKRIWVFECGTNLTASLKANKLD